MSLPTIESSFVTLTTKGIQGFDHAEYPVVRLAMEVLNATESYLWRYIRGSGLAYGAYLSLDVESGLLSFSLYRSSNCIKAFEAAASMMQGLVDNLVDLDETMLDAAKSTIVYGVTKNVSTASRAAMVSYINQALKGISRTHQIDLLEKYQKVTKADVLNALRKHFLPLFDPASSIAVVVTAPGNAQDVGEGLEAAGFEVTQKELHIDPLEMEMESESDSGMSTDSR